MAAASFAAAVICAGGGVPAVGCWTALLLTLALVAAVPLLRASPRGDGTWPPAHDGALSVPWYWFALPVAGAFGMFVVGEAREPNWAVWAAAFTPLAVVGLAAGLGALPPILSGADLPAERFVDARIRFGRAAEMLQVAYAALALYAWFVDFGGWSNIVRSLTLIALSAYASWLTARQKRSPRTVF